MRQLFWNVGANEKPWIIFICPYMGRGFDHVTNTCDLLGCWDDLFYESRHRVSKVSGSIVPT